MVKGSLGTGILAMPMAFKNAGLWVGLSGAFFIGLLCTHCVSLLVSVTIDRAPEIIVKYNFDTIVIDPVSYGVYRCTILVTVHVIYCCKDKFEYKLAILSD